VEPDIAENVGGYEFRKRTLRYINGG
jgi:hypothetical protein